MASTVARPILNPAVDGTRGRRCALYARFSSDMQSARSADDQLRECRAYATRMGWTIVAEERDDMVRAGDMAGRHGYQRLLELALARGFDVFVCEELSRFSRNLFEAFGELGPLTSSGVRLATLREGLLDLTDAPGLIQASVGFTMAQIEVKKIGERSKRGLTGRVLAKFSGGGAAPYGYRRRAVLGDELPDGTRAKLGVRFEPAPDEASVVRRIFREFAQGWARHAIAVGLNRDAVPTRRAGMARGSATVRGAWTISGVTAVLSNPIACGTLIWNKKSRNGDKGRGGRKTQTRNEPGQRIVVENFCESIVDREQWETVEARLEKDRRLMTKRGLPANPNQSRVFLLSGLMRCASCGANFSIGARRGGHPAYRCPSRQTGACSNKSVVSQPGLEARVRKIVETVCKDRGKLADLVAEHNAHVDEANAALKSAVDRLGEHLHNKQMEKEHLVAAVKIGGDVAVLVDALREVERECAEIGSRIEDARGRIQLRLEPHSSLADFEIGGAMLLSIDDPNASPTDRARARTADRLLLQRFIAGVLVYDDGSIFIRFRADGLFAPVLGARLPALAMDASDGDIDTARRKLRQDRLNAEIDRFEADDGEHADDPIELDVLGATVQVDRVGADHPDLTANGEHDSRADWIHELNRSAEVNRAISGSRERPQRESNPR